jgi:hypothetical protein
MKLIIAGSRSITSYDTVKRALIESGLWAEHGKAIEVVSGKAKGVDTLGEEIAKKAGLKIHDFPADWDNIKAPGAVVKKNSRGKYNVMAGIQRNHDMGDFADAALVVWDGVSTGSLDMATYMASLGKRSIVFPVRKISVDLYDKLERLGIEIILPNSLTAK